jgi:sugar lactone lactonase YvrE
MRLPLLMSAALGAATAPFATAAPAPDPCRPWTVTDLATGLGVLENLLPTSREIYYSGDAVVRFTRSGGTSTVTAADSPGGLRIRGGGLFFVTGDGLQSGAFGRADGTLRRYDLRSHRTTTVATGLTMPNGFTFLPDGSALTSRDVSGLHPTGITRVVGSRVQERWSDQADSNGLAVDPTGRYLYSDETFTYASTVYRTEIAHPSRRTVVATLGEPGVPKGLDDLTLASSGALYLAANSAGEVIRLDPRTGRSCVVATGLTTVSSVRQGAGGAFPTGRLYATTFSGRLAEIVPPPGVRP